MIRSKIEVMLCDKRVKQLTMCGLPSPGGRMVFFCLDFHMDLSLCREVHVCKQFSCYIDDTCSSGSKEN